MLLDTDRDRNIDLLGKKVSIFCWTHIAVGHRIQGGRPGPLRLPSTAANTDGSVLLLLLLLFLSLILFRLLIGRCAP